MKLPSFLQSKKGEIEPAPAPIHDLGNPLGLLRRNEFVNDRWYRATYSIDASVNMSADEHYLVAGAKSGCEPNPLFRTRWYVRRYPSVAESRLNPAVHYLALGSRNGLKPNPLFDPAWYRKAYPDVAASGLEPLVHYMKFGAREGRSPGPEIFSQWLPKGVDIATGEEALSLAVYLDLLDRLRTGLSRQRD